jgi:hypothetical protein
MSDLLVVKSSLDYLMEFQLQRGKWDLRIGALETTAGHTPEGVGIQRACHF